MLPPMLRVIQARSGLSRPLLVGLLVVAAGCKSSAAPDARPEGGAVVVVPPLPRRTTAEELLKVLPRSDAGRPVLATGHGVQIEFATKHVVDPISGRAVCLDLVANCSEANNGATDACFAAVPLCMTPTPWVEAETTPCCPRRCIESFQAARRTGLGTYEAFLKAFTDPDRGADCFPGVDEQLGRKSP